MISSTTLRNMLAAVALIFGALMLPAPAQASTGACSGDNHACAVWYSSSDSFSLQDVNCDGDYVYLVYWTVAGTQTRAENHGGCGTNKTVYAQITPGAQTISWFVCHNKNNWPDSCSSTISSSV